MARDLSPYSARLQLTRQLAEGKSGAPEPSPQRHASPPVPRTQLDGPAKEPLPLVERRPRIRSEERKPRESSKDRRQRDATGESSIRAGKRALSPTLHEKSRDLSKDRKRDRSRDRRRDRSRDGKRNRSRERSKDRQRDRPRERSKDGKRDRSRERSKHRQQDRARERSKPRQKDRSRERRRRDRSGGEREKEHSGARQRDRSPRRDRSKDKSKSSRKHRSRSRSRSRSRHRHRKDPSRRSRSRSRSHSPSASPSPPPPKRRRRTRSPSAPPHRTKKHPLPPQELSFRGLDNSALPPTQNGGIPPTKQTPNFHPTGALALAANRVAGTKISLKYNEPPEARKPSPTSHPWRLFVFKGPQVLDTLELAHKSCWLLGRAREVVDYVLEHPSASAQHAVLQFRYVVRTVEDECGVKTQRGRVRPYVIDLESSNGTELNGEMVAPSRYVELRDKDILRFAGSEREYVIMLPPPAEAK